MRTGTILKTCGTFEGGAEEKKLWPPLYVVVLSQRALQQIRDRIVNGSKLLLRQMRLPAREELSDLGVRRLPDVIF